MKYSLKLYTTFKIVDDVPLVIAHLYNRVNCSSYMMCELIVMQCMVMNLHMYIQVHRLAESE